MRRFVVSSPGAPNREVAWSDKILTIGRDKSNDLELTGAQVADFHAIIRDDEGDGVPLLFNLSLEHPVRKGGAPVLERHQLTDNESFTIGFYTLCFKDKKKTRQPPRLLVGLRGPAEKKAAPYATALTQLDLEEMSAGGVPEARRIAAQKDFLEYCRDSDRGQELTLALECAALFDVESEAAELNLETILAQRDLHRIQFAPGTPWTEDLKELAEAENEGTEVKETVRSGWLLKTEELRFLVRPARVTLKTP